MVRGAWLFSSLVVVDDAARLRPLLAGVYDALEQPFDSASVGSRADEVPGLDTATVEQALVAGYADVLDLTEAPLDPALVEDAAALVDQHRVAG